MKRKWKIGFVAIVLIAASLMLCACDNLNITKDTSFTIQYSDDTGLHTITVESGALYSLESIPQRNGYVFIGLYDAKAGGTQYVDEDGNCVSAFKDNRNLVLYPQFKAKEYTLVLDYGEAAVTGMRQMTVNYGQTLAELPMNLQVENKTFVGWFTEQNKGGVQVADQYGVIPQNAIVDEDTFDLSDPRGFINLYAGFKGQEYLVTFYYGNDPTPEEMLIEYGTYITDVVTTKRVNGKAVITWSKSKGVNAQNDIFTGKVTDSMVLYAYEYAPVIDFDANGGKAVAPIVRKTGTAIELPTPERKDYTFAGWYTENGSKYTVSIMPEDSVKLVAHWNAIISFNTNGGAAVESISEPAGTRITLPTTEKDGYMFAGWYTEQGQEYTATSMPEFSVKLTAKYRKIKTKQYVIVEATETVGNSKTPLNPDITDACYQLNVSDLYELGIKTIKVTVNYKVSYYWSNGYFERPPQSATAYMIWYNQGYASDAYVVWQYGDTIKHNDNEIKNITRSTTISLSSEALYICRYQSYRSTDYNSSARWTDFWVEIEYPDMSRLY